MSAEGKVISAVRYSTRQVEAGWDVVDSENGDYAPFYLRGTAEGVADKLNQGLAERSEWGWIR